MKILIDENMPYAQVLFGRLGDVRAVPGREISALSLAGTDALMVRSATRVDRALLSGSQVSFVGTATSGSDHVDEDWLVHAGIAFSAAPGCNAIAVVEYVFSALLYLAQRDGFALRDKAVGIVGVGNVGACLQRRLDILGVCTMLCDPPLAEAGIPGDWLPLEKLVAEADVLTFHTPLTYAGHHATWHLVDEALLAALPPGRIIINTCRGAIIDNGALLRALEEGKLLNVVLDVWESEPALSSLLLARVDIGTAHIAGYTLEGRARGTVQVFNAYSAFIGKDERADMSVLLPQSTVELIRLRGTVDEEMLRLLVQLVYDVRRDDAQLRRATGLPGGFDRLRKQYYQRREWSSICVETDDDAGVDTLRQLGFRTCSSVD